MINNDYERDDSNFEETKDQKDDGLTVFNFDDTSNSEKEDYEEEEYEEEDEDEEDRPRRKLSAKGILIICVVIIVGLLIATIAGWVYGIGQHNSYAKIEEEKTQLANQVSGLKSQITSLQAENDDLKSKIGGINPDGTPSSVAGTYKLLADVNLRNEPSLNGEAQPEGLKANSEVQIVEISAITLVAGDDDDAIVWAKTAEGYHFALVIDGELTAVKTN